MRNNLQPFINVKQLELQLLPNIPLDVAVISDNDYITIEVSHESNIKDSFEIFCEIIPLISYMYDVSKDMLLKSFLVLEKDKFKFSFTLKDLELYSFSRINMAYSLLLENNFSEEKIKKIEYIPKFHSNGFGIIKIYANLGYNDDLKNFHSIYDYKTIIEKKLCERLLICTQIENI